MMRKLTSLALVLALLPALTIMLPTNKAEARNGRNAAFVAGLAIGALGTAAFIHHNNQYNDRWVGPRNHYHRHFRRGWHTHNGVRHKHVVPRKSRPVRYKTQRRYKPWTAKWYRYCANRYRSFNARTGYFRGYDGRRHFCR